MKKGSAQKADHNSMSHAFWWHAAKKKMGIRIERVESKLNIADDPSRNDLASLNMLGAEWKNPSIPNIEWSSIRWQPMSCSSEQ